MSPPVSARQISGLPPGGLCSSARAGGGASATSTATIAVVRAATTRRARVRPPLLLTVTPLPDRLSDESRGAPRVDGSPHLPACSTVPGQGEGPVGSTALRSRRDVSDARS